MTRSIADIEQELETLEQDLDDLRKEKKRFVDHILTDLSARQALHDLTKCMHEVLEKKQVKREEIKVLRERGEETNSLPPKRQRLSLPAATCGSKWTSTILDAYYISFLEIDQLDEFLFQARPSKSDRAIDFEAACSIISLESLPEKVFPSSSNAKWFAKHLYAVTRGVFGNPEAAVDDMVIALFHSLGFNDEHLLTISRNKLQFCMSKSETTAEADVTVFNMWNLLRLAVVEDKRYEKGPEADDGEAQLVAEAIAASMYNRQQIVKNASRRRTMSEPSNSDSDAMLKPINDPKAVSDIPFFMVRVFGPYVVFYSHRFDDALLDCVAERKYPKTHTQIQKYGYFIQGEGVSGLNLLNAAHRKIVIETLDAIQQILST